MVSNVYKNAPYAARDLGFKQLAPPLVAFFHPRFSWIQILGANTKEKKGKRLKSKLILSKPFTVSRSTCDRFILSHGGSVRRWVNPNISGLSSGRSSVLKYLWKVTTVKASVKAGFRVIQYGAYAKMMAMVKITVNRELKQRQRRRRRERQKNQ